MKKLKVVSKKVLAKAKYLELIEEQIELPGGKIYNHISVLHPGAVVIIPQLPDGTFLLIEQYRHSVGQMLLEFPAGKLEVGEFPLESAKREIVEEVGFEAAQWIDLGILYPAPGFCNETQYLYLAKDLKVRKGQLDEDEIINVKQMTLNEIEEAVVDGRIKDAKTIAIFAKAKLKGLLKF